MEFIKFTLPPMSQDEDGNVNSPLILKTRREELGLTQQQVATGAHLQLVQYQRLERGERTIESSSLRTALSICAVLRLDPFLFLPESADMNSFIDTVEREDLPIMKTDLIQRLFAHALHLFNAKLGTEYTSDNIKLAFCTSRTWAGIRSAFSETFGICAEQEKPGPHSATLAEAFVGQTDCDDSAHVDGILIRTDAPGDLDNPEAYLHILVHEISHIFCTTNEIETASYKNQRFFDLYCAGKPATMNETISDGTMNAGYAIWREFIADILTDIVDQQPSAHLSDVKEHLLLISKEVKVGNSAAKACLTRYLSIIMNSWEGSEAETWSELKTVLTSMKLPFVNIVELVFENLHQKDAQCYEITPDFIADLGNAYMLGAIQNTPPAEIMEFANKFSYRLS